MEAFTITLPSNANPTIFPNNTASEYSTEFGNPIQLNGRWEVALNEITYYNNIYSLNNNEMIIYKKVAQNPLMKNVINDSDTIWKFPPISLLPLKFNE